MVWHFVKGDQRVECAVRRGNRPGTYAIVVNRPDAPQTMESIDHPAALVDRIVALTSELRNDGWQRA